MLRLSDAAPIVSAFATVVYAVFSIFLWIATRRNAEIAERTAEVAKQTAEATNRLFLEVNRPQLSFDTEGPPGPGLTTTINIVNTGNSPAKAARITMRRFMDGKEVDSQSYGPLEIPSRSKHGILLLIGDPLLIDDVRKGLATLEIVCEADALKAVARLLLRYRQIIRKAGINTSPDHYLLPKHLSRIAHGVNKGSRGYDPTQHQVYWDTAWHSLSQAAGLMGLRFHDLRHSFITAMVERGVPIGVIQSQVGHMSARMVMHYTHVASGVGQRAVDLLNAEPMLPELQELAGESTRSGLPN